MRQYCCNLALGLEFLLGWSWGLRGWVLLGWTGLVLPATSQIRPTRVVDGSAALVASLRGQQRHFATLIIRGEGWEGKGEGNEVRNTKDCAGTQGGLPEKQRASGRM